MSETDEVFALIGHLQAARQTALALQNGYGLSRRREGVREALICEAIARLTAVSALVGDCIQLVNDLPREPHEPA